MASRQMAGIIVLSYNKTSLEQQAEATFNVVNDNFLYDLYYYEGTFIVTNTRGL